MDLMRRNKKEGLAYNPSSPNLCQHSVKGADIGGGGLKDPLLPSLYWISRLLGNPRLLSGLRELSEKLLGADPIYSLLIFLCIVILLYDFCVSNIKATKTVTIPLNKAKVNDRHFLLMISFVGRSRFCCGVFLILLGLLYCIGRRFIYYNDWIQTNVDSIRH